MHRPKFNRIVGDKRYTVINKFKEECKRDVNNYEKTGRLHIVGTDTNITESDNLVDFIIEDNCYVNDKFIGTTVAKKIIVNILNSNNEIDLENKEIQVYAGMIINNINEEVPFGTFIIEKPDNEEVKEKTSFTGYDYMIKFNILYKDRVTYPCKAKVLFQDLCNQVGLEAGNLDFVNSDYIILGNPFTNNEDCRTVLSNIAQLAGGFAKIGRDNKVYIKTLKQGFNRLTVEYVNKMTVKELNLSLVKLLSKGKSEERADVIDNIDGNNYFDDFSKNKEWGELNSLVLRLSDVEGENTALDDKESIKANGLTEIVIQDNIFLINEEEREKAIIEMWNNLKHLKYQPFKTKYYGYPYLDSGDQIYIKDTKDKEYTSYIFNHTFTFNGTYSGAIDTPALTKTQTAYKNTFDLKSKFRKVELAVDKINGKITSEVSRIDEELKETSSKVEQTDTEIKAEIAQRTAQNEELNSKITQNVNEITSEVRKKVGNDEIISKINQSAEAIEIKANKISLERKRN